MLGVVNTSLSEGGGLRSSYLSSSCQILGYKDVHLVLSEDHAWVTFGKDGQETAEVTWHGKGNEDKRGQPISEGVAEKNWLYLNGKPVICNRPMEVAAMVSAINPSINSTMDSSEMASLQQELLWLLHDMGYLSKYPMALGNLGDLEEMSRSPGQPPPLALFQEGIDADKKYYDNQHVYPYTYMGAFLFRNGQYKKALNFWSNASAVMKGYNYNREDEEIYKEFLEIDNDFIPQIVKTVDKDKKGSFLRDPECYADLLRFYDGICEWEEDYLLGGGEPFTLTAANSSSADTRVDYDEFLSTKSNGTQFIGMTVDSLLKAESPADMMMCRKTPDIASNNFTFPTVSLKLRSKKMKGLKKILQSPKLNASAIKLQLTAQSQVEFRHNRRTTESSDQPSTTTRKRLRRE
ncbi:MEN1 [Acanthosepion pharaonis]|uniref:Menin n=1 Tax=Acanthosepion pharaonis TaxID=158019 RepID=A0A812AST4_ACAPH|nr:MEN1 [Sepia pharaonis]